MRRKCLIICTVILILSGCANQMADREQPFEVILEDATNYMIEPEQVTKERGEDIPVESTVVEEVITEEIDSEPNEEIEVKEVNLMPILEDEMCYLDPNWEYVDYTIIHEDGAMLYRATQNRKNIVIGVDAGHGTAGASGQKVYCHPDKSLKTTGGSTAAGSLKANAQSAGMTFTDGTSEGAVTLQVAENLKSKLLNAGYDVLMLRETETTKLDLLARTILANHKADCHISIHFDGDGLDYDKGVFYISVPDGIKQMSPVDSMWEMHNHLGECIIERIKEKDIKIYSKGHMAIDLVQTSYSTVPSVDVELGNQCSNKNMERLDLMAEGILEGVELFYNP